MDKEKAYLEFLRTQFPIGSRIKLTAMGSDPQPLAPGSVGTLKAIDDVGTFHIEWDNGRSLGLVPGEDQFKVLPPETTLLKLYMPLMGCLHERDKYGDLEEEPQELSGKDLWRYEDAVNGVILKNRAPEEAESGIMHWYGEDDEVNRKVRRVEFAVEERERQLWGVAECHITEPLTFKEMCALKRFVSGQASDGWGEGLEQRPIYLEDDAELYIHLWQSNGYFIRTEEEQFVTGIQQCADGLPEMCFSVISSTGELICIKRGESGYYHSDWNTEDAQENRELADICNAKLGVSMAQRLAMETGSMHGWHVPGADPKAYEALGEKEEVQCQTM